MLWIKIRQWQRSLSLSTGEVELLGRAKFATVHSGSEKGQKQTIQWRIENKSTSLYIFRIPWELIGDTYSKDDFAPCLWTVLASEAEPELSGATCAELNSRSNNERMSLGIHTVQVQVFDLHIHVRFCQVPWIWGWCWNSLAKLGMPVASSGHIKKKLKPHTARLFWLTRLLVENSWPLKTPMQMRQPTEETYRNIII